ncbi:MAG: hypothetical protein WBX25_27210 [Rhodomicrobium sp.]
MKETENERVLGQLEAFVAVLSISGAFAQTTTYKIDLKSSEEVPPPEQRS